MKISNMHLPRFVKNVAVAMPLFISPMLGKSQSLPSLDSDVFVKSEELVVPEINDSMELSPEIQIGDEYIYPAVVVDLSENMLYYYDLGGYLADVYPVASGKKSTPTKPGLRIITGIEKFPYNKASSKTKRYKNPENYGSNVICLSNVDIKTGKITGSDGQFLHGTFIPHLLGKRVSNGCIRVHNDIIELLADELDKGQYVLIKE